eukprot:506035_1
MATERNTKTRLIFLPYGTERVIWDSFIMIALVYTTIEIPVTAAFNLHLTLDPPNVLGVLAFTIDMLLLCDIALNFRTAYVHKYDRLTLIVDPTRIAKKYLRRWFLFDLIASFPFEFIINNPQYDHIIKITRFIKLLRVFKVFKLFNGLTKQFVAREAIITIKLFKIMGAMILTAHYFACIWFYVGMVHYEKQNNNYDSSISTTSNWIEQSGLSLDDTIFVQYSFAWYWAIVTLFTTGYGDITAHNVTEQWVCSICILAGSILFAYFIGTLTAVVAEGDRVRSYEISRVEEAKAFCDHHKFTKELTRKVLTHIRYFCHYNFVLDQDEIVSTLPPFLQKEVQRHISNHHLKLSEIDLFKDLPQEIIGQISLTMNSISCNMGQYLYKTGDIAQCLYLQRTGNAQLKYANGLKKHMRLLKRGDIVGEQALLYGKRKYSVICTTWSEFYVLRVEDIKRVFLENFKPKRFKKEWKQIRHLVNDKQNIIRKCSFGGRSRSSFNQTINAFSVRDKSLKNLLETLKPHRNKNVFDNNDEEKTQSNLFQSQVEIPMSSTHEFTRVKLYDESDNELTVNSKSNISILRKLSTFNFRQNSEKRNKKVLANRAEISALNSINDEPSYDGSLTLTTRYRKMISVDDYQLDFDFTSDEEEHKQMRITKQKSRKTDIGMKTMGKYSRHRKQNFARSKLKKHVSVNKNDSWIVDDDSNQSENENEMQRENENDKCEMDGKEIILHKDTSRIITEDTTKDINKNKKSDNDCIEMTGELVNSVES